MVAKKKTTSKATKKSRVKVGKLKVNKETVKNLSDKESKQVKGGVGARKPCAPSLVTTCPGVLCEY